MRVNELLCTYGASQQKCSRRAAKAARGKEACNMFSGALTIMMLLNRGTLFLHRSGTDIFK